MVSRVLKVGLACAVVLSASAGYSLFSPPADAGTAVPPTAGYTLLRDPRSEPIIGDDENGLIFAPKLAGQTGEVTALNELPIEPGSVLASAADQPDGRGPLPRAQHSHQSSCHDVIVNGGFEQGPYVGWRIASNGVIDGRTVGLADVILNDADVAREGEWFGLLGGGVNIIEQLSQKVPILLPPADRLESATLTYRAGHVTDERRNGIHDDWFGPVFVNQDNELELVPASFMTEETSKANTWYQFDFDVTEMMKQRSGWSTMRLMFHSEQNGTAKTSHFLDSVSLEVCESGSQLPTATVAPVPEQLCTGSDIEYRTTSSMPRITLCLKADRSAITKARFENLDFSCGGMRRTVGRTESTYPEGLAFVNRTFSHESRCNLEWGGTFSADFATVSGTWRGIMCNPTQQEVCRGSTTSWQAGRQRSAATATSVPWPTSGPTDSPEPVGTPLFLPRTLKFYPPVPRRAGPSRHQQPRW